MAPGLVGQHSAATSIWASYLLFRVCLLDISYRVSNYHLTIII